MQINFNAGKNTADSTNCFIPSTGEFFPTITTTDIVSFLPTKVLIDTKFIQTEEANYIEMIYKVYPAPFNITYTVTWSVPQKEEMLKEVYGVIDGKLQLIKSIKGTETAAHYVPATINWEE